MELIQDIKSRQFYNRRFKRQKNYTNIAKVILFLWIVAMGVIWVQWINLNEQIMIHMYESN